MTSAWPSSRTRVGCGAFLLDLPRADALDALDDSRPVSEDRAVHAPAVVRERRVRAGHLERVDRERPEPDREVGVEGAADAERVRGLHDRLRADEVRQLRVDGVVGGDHRAGERHAPEVGVVVVRDVPDAVAGVDRDLLRHELGLRRDPGPHRRGEDDRLERRAGLALGLGGEVELALAEVPPPNIAFTAPVRGSMATSAAAGPSGFASTFSIARRAFSWSVRSIVVVTRSPPPNTRPAPYFSTSWSLT